MFRLGGNDGIAGVGGEPHYTLSAEAGRRAGATRRLWFCPFLVVTRRRTRTFVWRIPVGSRPILQYTLGPGRSPQPQSLSWVCPCAERRALSSGNRKLRGSRRPRSVEVGTIHLVWGRLQLSLKMSPPTRRPATRGTLRLTQKCRRRCPLETMLPEGHAKRQSETRPAAAGNSLSPGFYAVPAKHRTTQPLARKCPR